MYSASSRVLGGEEEEGAVRAGEPCAVELFLHHGDHLRMSAGIIHADTGDLKQLSLIREDARGPFPSAGWSSDETATPTTLMARKDGRAAPATTARHYIGKVGHQNEEPTKDKDAKRIGELESTRETSADSPRAAAQSPTRRRTSRCRPSESTIGVFRLWDGGQ